MAIADSVSGPFVANEKDGPVIVRFISASLPWGTYWHAFTLNRRGVSGRKYRHEIMLESGATHVRHVYRHQLGGAATLEAAAASLHEIANATVDHWETADMWTVPEVSAIPTEVMA